MHSLFCILYAALVQAGSPAFQATLTKDTVIERNVNATDSVGIRNNAAHRMIVDSLSISFSSPKAIPWEMQWRSGLVLYSFGLNSPAYPPPSMYRTAYSLLSIEPGRTLWLRDFVFSCKLFKPTLKQSAQSPVQIIPVNVTVTLFISQQDTTLRHVIPLVIKGEYESCEPSDVKKTDSRFTPASAIRPTMISPNITTVQGRRLTPAGNDLPPAQITARKNKQIDGREDAMLSILKNR